MLDPIADKGLLLTGNHHLELEQVDLRISPLVLGSCHRPRCGHRYRMCDLEASQWPPRSAAERLGKAASALQMVAVSWVMLQLPFHIYSVYLAGVFTLVSGIGYLANGLGQLRHHDSPGA